MNDSRYQGYWLDRNADHNVAAFRQLCIETFTDTYGPHNSRENLLLYLTTAFDEDRIKREFADTASAFYLISHTDKPVAYMKINHGPPPQVSDSLGWLEIERIYVRKDYQGQKLGARMIQEAARYALHIDCLGLWLGVWEKNLSAYHFYQKMGFKLSGEQIFMFGNEAQKDHIMTKHLSDG